MKFIILRTGLICSVFLELCLSCVFASQNEDTIVITSEEIQAMQVLKMADVLNNLPGIKAGNSSVSIHGSYKVKVFVDGRSINDPTSSHGGVNWDPVLPEDVVRIEILRGKGGLKYGQDAGGGVILISTKKTKQLTGNIKAYAGNLDTQNLNATIGKFTTGIGGSYETTDGYKINNDKTYYYADGLPGPPQTWLIGVNWRL